MRLVLVRASKPAQTRQVVPMARMVAQMLTRLEEVWATKLELRAHWYLAYSLPDGGWVVIREMEVLVEGRNIQAVVPETLLHRRSPAHSAASTLHHQMVQPREDLQIATGTVEVMLLRIGGVNLGPVHLPPSLALVPGLDRPALEPQGRPDQGLAEPAVDPPSSDLIRLDLCFV